MVKIKAHNVPLSIFNNCLFSGELDSTSNVFKATDVALRNQEAKAS